jgi:hypothetical protein
MSLRPVYGSSAFLGHDPADEDEDEQLDQDEDES